jgi:hypothetical protein
MVPDAEDSDTIEGMRHQVMATDTPPGGGSIQFLEAATGHMPRSTTMNETLINS